MAATADELNSITEGLYREHGKRTVQLVMLMEHTGVVGRPHELGDLNALLTECFRAYMDKHGITRMGLVDAQAALRRSAETIALLDALAD
jgi:hypothetical protein